MQSFFGVLNDRIEKLEETHGSAMARRSFPSEKFIYMHAVPSMLMLIFPYVPGCHTDTYYMRFERGERIERSGDIMWLLGSQPYAIKECAFLHYDRAAVITRMALLSMLLHLPECEDVFKRYSSTWGGGFQMQCVACHRAYVAGMGWSYSAFPFLRELPKVVCPLCHP